MKIELYIDGEEKLFTTPFVPKLAQRKYFKIQAESERKSREDENYFLSPQEQLDEEDELVGILADVVFGGQFTVEQVYNGASDEYIYDKLREAVFGKPKENIGEAGNNQGE